MSKKEQIVTYYTNARELVRRGQPKAARAYVLEILNAGLSEYHKADSILAKAHMQAFLEKWIAVSRQLYDKGVTDDVLRCFGLAGVSVQRKGAANAAPSAPEARSAPEEEGAEALSVPFVSGHIDMMGLLEDAANTQGWCATLFEAHKMSVVKLSVSTASRGASGTGFVISEHGYLLTNDHVVFDEASGRYYAKIYMTPMDSKSRYEVKVLFSDKKTDIALCQFDPAAVQGVTAVKRIPCYDELKQGADCLVIGNAFDMGLAPFAGTVRFTRNEDGDLVYTAPANPGDSGGPVLNRNGECIGITKSRTEKINGDAAAGYSNATPMDTVNAILQKWTSANHIIL